MSSLQKEREGGFVARKSGGKQELGGRLPPRPRPPVQAQLARVPDVEDKA